ncbi:MAG: NarK/NasA family nitrate transporter [Blastocatellia bacterium]|nr:NarK/NasA family nitrate transporter [Blastocatellia bacterium]
MANKELIKGSEHKWLMGMIAAGGVGAVAGLLLDPSSFWPAYLVNAFYFLTLALAAVVFVSIQHLSNAGWSAVIRRVPEAMTAYLPFGAIAMLAVFFGRHSLYEWTHGLGVYAGSALKVKATFLSEPFFFGRMAVMLAVWCLLAWLLVRESRRQDADGSLDHTRRSRAYSAIFLAAFAVTFSLASFDWLMSIEPEFYSTIFAFYCFSGLFLSGVSAITVLVVMLRRRGLLPQVHESHLHNLGKLVFAFSTFWAYIWLCQYLLIYYANLPEETIYYIRRTASPGWTALFILNLFLNWIIPFIVLLPRKAKQNESILLFVCGVVLAGHWIDIYTMVAPVFSGTLAFGPVDLSVALGFAALFLMAFNRGLAKSAIVPAHDPYLTESLSLARPQPDAGIGWSRDAARALALSTLAFGITFAVWGLMGGLAPMFRDMYHLSPVQTSLLVAVPVLLGSVGRIPMGIFGDRFGGRIVMGLLLIFCLIPALGVSFAGSYQALIAWGFLIGFAGASFSVGVAFASKWFPANQQGTALGIYGIGNIGQSIAVFGAPALVAATGDWRVPFWVYGGASCLFGAIFLLLARNAPVKAQPRRMREYMGIFLREPLAWVLSLFYFITFGGFVALSLYLPTLLKDIFSLSPTDAGARVAGFVVVATLMRPVGGWLADSFGGANVLLIVLGSIAILALGMTSSSMVVFTIGALGTAAMLGMGNGAVFKLVPEYFPRETGTVTGLVGAAGGLGGFFPPLVMGVIRAQTGAYAMGFVFLSGFALVCLAVNYLVFLRRPRRGEEAMPASW